VRPSAALHREWRRRLRESGFHDIEYGDRAEGWREVQSYYHLSAPVERGAHEAYFRRAGEFCWEWRFRKLPKTIRQIWRLHADGLSMVEIGKRVGRTTKQVQGAVGRCRLLAGLPETTEAWRGASGHGSFRESRA